MPIEKAFAIDAPPHEIYAAIERDLASASAHAGETFQVLRRDPDRAIDLRVTISGIPCWLTYRLEPREAYTEVIALLTPFGFRYTFFRIITFGLRNQGFEYALVSGLANLKAAVERKDGGAGARRREAPAPGGE
ncbi:MAG TPA: hypothetical protein VFC53_10800 [Dehalococcoidia bacterium]|nr:hypothetical protein [Dehalococcoidia bacterium]